MQVLVNITNILVKGNNTKIPATGNTKCQLHGTIQNTTYYEQYKILVTGNNAKYQLQETIQTTIYKKQYKIPVTGTNTKYQLQVTIQTF